MFTRIKRFLGIFLIMTQLFGITTIYANGRTRTRNDIILINADNIYENTEYYKNSVFGVAGGFNLVGFNSVEGTTNISGNILTNTLKYNADFGTKGVKEVSYCRNIQTNNSMTTADHEDSILVVGRNVSIGTTDNGNSWAINGQKLNKPQKVNGLWQDGERDFIDLNKVEKETIDLANRLSQLEDWGITLDSHTHSPVGNKTDPNNQNIKVSTREQFTVYNMRPEDFNLELPIPIKGFDKTSISTLIINVDMKNKGDSFLIPRSIASYTDGTAISNGATKNWSNVNVIWNIFDSSKPNNIYTGKIENRGHLTGTILSPGAKVIVRHSIEGNIIARDIVAAGGSTFRNDYVELEIQSIEIDPPEKELIAGQTFQLKAVLKPAFIATPKLNWSSSDPSVASVDENGKVLALKKGEAVITVETESGLQARSNITVRSLLVPTDISRPDLAGYNFVHPQSLTRINMKMMVESEMGSARLTMAIPNIGLLFGSVEKITLNGSELSSSSYTKGDKFININLGDLTGEDEHFSIYHLEVYVRMQPATGLNIVHYNQRVSSQEKLVISNELRTLMDLGEVGAEEIIFELEPYNLELMRIPKIN